MYLVHHPQKISNPFNKSAGYAPYGHFCSGDCCKQRGGNPGILYGLKHDPPTSRSTKMNVDRNSYSSNHNDFKIVQLPKYLQNMPKSTLSSMEFNWIKLTDSIIKTTSYQSPIIPINDKEIIIHLTRFGTSGFWKYSVDDNQCDLIASDAYIGSKYFSMYCYNKKENAIYLFGSNKQISIIHLNDNMDDVKIEKIETSFNQIERGVIIQVDDNTYHLIGDRYKNAIWNINSKKSIKYSVNHNFNAIHASFYSKSKREIIVIDGKNNIWIYGINEYQQRWIRLGATLRTSKESAYILSNDDRYLIIFGDSCDDDSILIYDLEQRNLFKSKINCPAKGKVNAVLMSNCIDNNLVMSGYLRQDIMNNHGLIGFMPMDIINLLTMFYVTPYSSDYIHLFECGATRHWKMCLDFILRL